VTKSRRNLLVTIQQENVSRGEIKEPCEILDSAKDDAMDAMMRLSNKYIANKDCRSSERLIQEIDKIKIEYTDAQNRAQQVFDELSRAASYSKFIKKLEDTSQKQRSDLVKSKDDQTFSIVIEKSYCTSQSIYQRVPHNMVIQSCMQQYLSQSYIVSQQLSKSLMKNQLYH